MSQTLPVHGGHVPVYESILRKKVDPAPRDPEESDRTHDRSIYVKIATADTPAGARTRAWHRRQRHEGYEFAARGRDVWARWVRKRGRTGR